MAFIQLVPKDGNLQFRFWIGLLICFYGGLGIVGVLVQHYLAKNDQAIRWLDYGRTMALALIYCRALTHHVTLSLLKKWSTTCNTLPSQVQDDSAFSIVDNATFLMWAPLVAYWVIEAVAMDGDDFIFYCLPSLRALMPYYVIDRILHIWVNPRRQRIMHHLGLLIAVACFTELNPSVQSMAIGVYGSIIDTYHKGPLVWHTICRFTRNHARTHPDWRRRSSDTEDTRRGIDRLLIGKSPETMAFYGKFCAVYTYLFGIFIPCGMLIVYFVRHWHEMPLPNRIVQPIVPLFFTLVDVPLYKACWTTSQQNYWEQDFAANGKQGEEGHQDNDGKDNRCDQTDEERIPVSGKPGGLLLSSVSSATTTEVSCSIIRDQNFHDDLESQAPEDFEA